MATACVSEDCKSYKVKEGSSKNEVVMGDEERTVLRRSENEEGSKERQGNKSIEKKSKGIH